jgi:hypothetical protein
MAPDEAVIAPDGGQAWGEGGGQNGQGEFSQHGMQVDLTEEYQVDLTRDEVTIEATTAESAHAGYGDAYDSESAQQP